MTIELSFTDGFTPYDLTWENSIFMGKVQLGELKKIPILLKNNNPLEPCTNVIVEATAHPTDQIGTAEDTYLALYLSTEENGTYTHSLGPFTLNANEQKVIWLRWTIKEEQNPGILRFAIKVNGRYTL